MVDSKCERWRRTHESGIRIALAKNSKRGSMRAPVGMSIVLSCCMLAESAGAASPDIARILDSLKSVHSLGEVAISPDGRRVVFGNVVTGKRGEAEVDATALWLADARDGSGAT